MRYKVLRVIISILFFVIGCNLVYIQIIRGQDYFNLSVNNRIRVIPLKELRGRVLDRNGVVLAQNRLSFNVTVIPQDIKDKDALFAFLSDVLDTDRDILNKRFVRKHATPFAPVILAEDVDKRMAMILEENKFRFPGLYIEETFRREYPFRSTGAHVLGNVGKITKAKIEEVEEYGYTPQSIVGYSGIEDYYDTFLRGRPGGVQIEVNNRGQQVRLLSLKDPQKGEDVRLTIDQRIQEVAANALGTKRGAIIVMNLDSGEILGLVSSPPFDPNTFTSVKLQNNVSELYTDEAAPLLNRAIQGLYPPGSVFKIVLTLAGLDSGKIKPETTFNCPGYFKLGRRRFHCLHVHGQQNLYEGIIHSCNVYFYNVGDIIGPDIIHKYARMFGLGKPTKIDLPFERRGQIPSRIQRKIASNRGWFRGDTLNLSIGQGDILVTPLQVLGLMATIARSGKVVQPHLIKSVGAKDIVKFATIKHVRVSKKSYDVLQAALRSVVADPHGTARILNIPGFEVSGKTGTAQTAPGKNSHAWFVGYDMSTQPKIAFCVFLEYGGSSYYACRMARDMLKRLRAQQIL